MYDKSLVLEILTQVGNIAKYLKKNIQENWDCSKICVNLVK